MKRAMLGDVEFSVVESENPEYSNEVTSNPVELGTDIVDHVRQKPISHSIKGIVTGEKAAESIAKLRRYLNDGIILRYVGRNVIDNLVIESLSTTHDKSIRNGFSFQITLKHVRIAKSQMMEIQLPNPIKAPKPQTNPPKNNGYQYPNEGPTKFDSMDQLYDHLEKSKEKDGHTQFDSMDQWYEHLEKVRKKEELIKRSYDIEGRWMSF